MSAIIDGFNWIIDFFRTIFDFITNTFTTLAMVFQYIFTIVEVATNVILSLPTWLQAFGLITISVCAVYIIVGRDAGKSDSKGGSK